MQTDDAKENPRQIAAFGRFLKLLPHGQGLTLVTLKGHILIEEQVRAIIDAHVRIPEAVTKAELTCHQAICIAEAFCPKEQEPWFWSAVRKLNKIRNEIAHNSEPSGLEDRVDDFVRFFPSGLDAEDRESRFELTLWSLFERVSALAEPSAATIPEVIKEKDVEG